MSTLVTPEELKANESIGWRVDRRGDVYQVVNISPRKVRYIGKLSESPTGNSPKSQPKDLPELGEILEKLGQDGSDAYQKYEASEDTDDAFTVYEEEYDIAMKSAKQAIEALFARNEQLLNEKLLSLKAMQDEEHGSGANVAWEAGIDWRNQLRDEIRKELG